MKNQLFYLVVAFLLAFLLAPSGLFADNAEPWRNLPNLSDLNKLKIVGNYDDNQVDVYENNHGRKFMLYIHNESSALTIKDFFYYKNITKDNQIEINISIDYIVVSTGQGGKEVNNYYNLWINRKNKFMKSTLRVYKPNAEISEKYYHLDESPKAFMPEIKKFFEDTEKIYASKIKQYIQKLSTKMDLMKSIINAK